MTYAHFQDTELNKKNKKKRERKQEKKKNQGNR